MTLPEIANDIAQMYGASTYALATAAVQARILVDINKAIQELQGSGEDFFAREELSVPLVADTGLYALPKNVQTVLKPARLDDGTILTKLTSRGQLFQYGPIFREQGGTVPSGKPSAYFVESLGDASDVTGDNVAIIVHLLPAPATSVAATLQLLLDVIKEPTPATSGQLASGSTLLGIPHKLIESVFLPLARYNASGSYFFYAKDKKPQIDAEYARALRVLGKSDPRRPQPTDSNSAALETSAQRPDDGRQAAA